MKFITTLIISAFLAASPIWQLDFDKAKTQANTEKKQILLYFGGSDWCVPCIKLKKEILETAQFQEFAQKNLVMVLADFPRKKKNMPDAKQVAKNEALAEKYNPNGSFPLMLLIDAQGKVVKTWDGYPKTMNTLGLMQEIKK
jgi:thioredoxin-related protein